MLLSPWHLVCDAVCSVCYMCNTCIMASHMNSMVTGFGAKVKTLLFCVPYFDRKAQHTPFAPFRTRSLRHRPDVARSAAVQLLLKRSFIAPKLSDSSSDPFSCCLVQCFKITGKSLKEALRNQGHLVLLLSRDLHRCLVKQCKALDHRTLQQVST